MKDCVKTFEEKVKKKLLNFYEDTKQVDGKCKLKLFVEFSFQGIYRSRIRSKTFMCHKNFLIWLGFKGNK